MQEGLRRYRSSWHDPGVTIDQWKELGPDAAAAEIYARVNARLSPEQKRAVIAWMPDEAALGAMFAAAPHDGGYVLGRVPYLAKDLFDVAGAPTYAGSTFLPKVRPAPRTHSALIRAARSAGLVCAGKTHLHEFAYGITGENPHYGDCDHPRFPGHTTGGSSSGSAAAVAAGIVPLAFGTDTGGSIRVPAAFCGLFGLRLSPGDPWARDAIPLSPSFDTVGWFTATATDMRHAIEALIGFGGAGRSLRGCYLEMPGVDPAVASACRNAAERFAGPADDETRTKLQQVFSRTLETYNAVVAVEAWEYHKAWAQAHQSEYDPAVWARLNRVHTITPEQVAAARQTCIEVQLLWTRFFLTYDFLIMPASPCPALTKAECTAENRTRILALTAPASVGGLPVLTIPIALPSGLTTGLQFVVNHPRSPVLSWVLERTEETARGVTA